MFAWSRDRTTLLLLHKTLSNLRFQLCRLLSGSMRCLLLNFEICSLEFGIFIDRLFRDTLLRPPDVQRYVIQKDTNPQNKLLDELNSCIELWGAVVLWITMSFQIFFLEMFKLNVLKKGQKRQIFWHSNGLGGGTLGWSWLPQILKAFSFTHKKYRFLSATHYDTKLKFHSAERKEKKVWWTGNAILEFVKFSLFYVLFVFM